MNDHSGSTFRHHGDRANGSSDTADSDAGAAAQSADASSDPGTELTQFRQLLFGDQLEDVERRLDRLEGAQVQAFERLQADQRARFDQLESLLRAELARVSRAQRRDREERSAANQQLSERLELLAGGLTQALASGIDGVRTEMAGAARQREDALAAQRAELQQAFDERASALETELEQARERLARVMADRDELSRLFGEVSRRLDGQLDAPEP
jgi:hypothetical protein